MSHVREDSWLSQTKRRKPVQARDIHGRLWESTLDTVSMGTCAPVNPCGWSAPVLPEQKYIKLRGDFTGFYIDILYDHWLADAELALETYEKHLFDSAMVIFGAEGPKAYDERSPALLRYCGLPPQAVIPIKAAKAGNPWILGLDPRPDVRLTKFFLKPKEVEEDWSTLQTEDYSQLEAETDDRESAGPLEDPLPGEGGSFVPPVLPPEPEPARGKGGRRQTAGV